MDSLKTKLIQEYLRKVRQANKESTKKEAFKDLLNRIYHGDKDVLKIVDKITLGAEATVLNIPRRDRIHKGSADTLYNRIIIEFENELHQTLSHAKEQLAGYLLGQYNTGEGYNYTLIAADFISWRVFAPDIDCIDRLHEYQEQNLKLNEIKSASFYLTDQNSEEFYYWIDRFLFKEEKQRATLKRIEESFGNQSTIFIDSYQILSNCFKEAKKYGEVQVAYEQWNKFLSVAYGSFVGGENIFLIHTYLSIFSKILAYSVVSNDNYIDNNELTQILDGTIFDKYNIRNFVENDFFHWVVRGRNYDRLKKVFRLIAQEISAYDFHVVDEDILKGVYQELIDIDTRHSLGEYYTPDWLCERIVNEFNFRKNDRILDPACGSGSFLRAAIHRIRKINPELTAEDINKQVYGIDIHPLSVQIAKTTLLLSLGKQIIEAREPVYINIILANTLLAPKGVDNLFGSDFTISIDRDKYQVTTQVLDDVNMFNDALELCENLAGQTMNKDTESFKVFKNIVTNSFSRHQYNNQIIESYYCVYKGFKKVKENGRDSIWKFIVQNLYKPYFYAEKFDYLIGNPPWFTYSSVKNKDYQSTLNQLAEICNVKPQKIANFPHLEIAAIFLAHCTDYFLKAEGKTAFVLPRSFFNADHHDNTRSGKVNSFQFDQIWDLENVFPLFRVPSCVFFVKKTKKRSSRIHGLKGLKFEGKLPDHNCNLSTASLTLKEEQVKWHYISQGKSTAISINKIKSNNQENPYKALFRQGATIVPRCFYFIEFNQDLPSDMRDRILNIKTSSDIQNDAKKPWKGIELTGKIESRFIFLTALSKSILPFVLHKPDLVVLPIIIETGNKGTKKVSLHSSSTLRQTGYLHASKWFYNVDNIWSINKTEKNSNITSEAYINWQNKLTDQDLDAPYLVMYNSSAKDANATILDRKNLSSEFLVESKAYWYGTKNINEAYYLTGILNSSVPNERMKDFQSRGLFGARDVHKKILDVYFPIYDELNELHKQLADLSKRAHKKALKFLDENPPIKELTAIHLGKLRVEIKTYLQTEMKAIDKIVKKIVK